MSEKVLDKIAKECYGFDNWEKMLKYYKGSPATNITYQVKRIVELTLEEAEKEAKKK